MVWGHIPHTLLVLENTSLQASRHQQTTKRPPREQQEATTRPPRHQETTKKLSRGHQESTRKTPRTTNRPAGHCQNAFLHLRVENQAPNAFTKVLPHKYWLVSGARHLCFPFLACEIQRNSRPFPQVLVPCKVCHSKKRFISDCLH